MSKKEIIIYTDGAARGNPGPGGYGVVMLFGDLRKEISEGFRNTTNNRMELLGVIVGLEAVKNKELKIKVYSDSKYVVDAVNKGWLWDWEKKRFKKKKNPDLWIRFIAIYKQLSVMFIWVKGHADIPENERCDELAVEASKGENLQKDDGYETENEGLLDSFL
jgi:ribonuclease HI